MKNNNTHTHTPGLSLIPYPIFINPIFHRSLSASLCLTHSSVCFDYGEDTDAGPLGRECSLWEVSIKALINRTLGPENQLGSESCPLVLLNTDVNMNPQYHSYHLPSPPALPLLLLLLLLCPLLKLLLEIFLLILILLLLLPLLLRPLLKQLL